MACTKRRIHFDTFFYSAGKLPRQDNAIYWGNRWGIWMQHTASTDGEVEMLGNSAVEHGGEQVGQIVIDHQLQVVFWNDWMEQVSGLDRVSARGNHLADLMPGLRASGLEAHILNAIFGSKTVTVKMPSTAQLAWAYNLEITVHPLEGESLTPEGLDHKAFEEIFCVIQFKRLADDQIEETPTMRPMPFAPKLLIAIDDIIARGEVSRLMSAQGYQVCEAANGVDAVRIIQLSDPFDLVLLDTALPLLSGVEAATQIRSLPGLRGITPLLALADLERPADRERLINAGFSEVCSTASMAAQLPGICRLLLDGGTMTTSATYDGAYHV